ncbi:FAD-dependent oxidoreductase [Acetomicrobium sp.]|uniref:NAD(P)/FAD-dependent oxidoreductase n=1 Tax=Acetomicrobium sp. TaxID=1872099 RepID=UPI002FC9A823
MRKQLVVVGGTAAGLSAASKAKRMQPGLEVNVFERSGFISYGACGLPYYIGGLVQTETELVDFTPEELYEKRGILAHTHHKVINISPANKTIDVLNLKNNETLVVPYDYLVIATGASPVIPDIPGIHTKGVFSLRTVEDGMKIKKAVQEARNRKAVVAGGGFIGLEVAEQLTFAGIDVTVVEAMPRLLPFLDEEYSNTVRKTLEEHDVNLFTNTIVSEIISSDGEVSGVKTSDGMAIEADFVIISVGVKPNSGLAKNAGLKIGFKNAIFVDAYMKTTDDSIWACGDCVQTYNFITKREAYVPLGTLANRQGRIAGENIAGHKKHFQGNSCFSNNENF